MHAKRVSTIVAMTTTLTIVGAACSSASEEGIERLIEANSGEDVEIDFDGDNGFALETEDGSFKVDADGNFVVEGPDGEVVTGAADGDGNFTVEGPDGEVLTASEDDGGFTIEGDDGSFSVNSDGEIPSEWPSGVPTPDSFTPSSSSVIDSPDGAIITLSGSSGQSGEDFVGSYGAALEAAGFESLGNFTSPTSSNANYDNGTWSVGIAAVAGTDDNVSVTIFPSS
jgi:hypothetical protein